MNIITHKIRLSIGLLRLYWPLIKSLQTGLLLATGLAGYLSSRPPFNILLLLGLTGSLFLAISGSTIMNMWYDRDIDARMKRTHMRPAASGLLDHREVFAVGMTISILGIGWAFMIAPRYGLVVLAGWFFDVIVYTVWLKRRTCWSILWGGISGAMPILAGRVLAVGEIELVGILLALSILFWIPTHTLTYSMKFRKDYKNAGVPTFPETYGEKFTRLTIAISSILAAVAIGWASVLIGLSAGLLSLIAVLTAVMLILAFATLRIHTDRMNFMLFRYASLYMLSAMIILSIQGLI
ncbi:MAG TPA: UbiA family prenyltransferase [Anaerolineales bacterium]|nr:UbiA family prenyltransferase [Anaerolineales bacterium]